MLLLRGLGQVFCDTSTRTRLYAQTKAATLLALFLFALISHINADCIQCNRCRTCQGGLCQNCGSGSFYGWCNPSSTIELECVGEPCDAYLAGWNIDVTVCSSFSGNGGCCTSFGECENQPAFGSCTPAEACDLNPEEPVATCGLGCGDPATCVRNVGRVVGEEYCLRNTISWNSVQCPAPTCSGLVFGPDGTTCKAYADPSAGFCTSSATCRTSTSDCVTIAGPAATGVSCADNRCFNSAGCVAGAAASTITTANVCFGDWRQAGCPSGFGCSPSNECVQKKANGLTCSEGGECLSGFCVGGRCCSTSSCPLCQNCNSGDCGAAPDGLNPSCPTVSCSGVVSGFSGTTCAAYTGSAPGYCTAGACDSSASRCSGQSTTTVGRPSCASSGCNKACTPFASVSAFDTVDEICHQSGRNNCGETETCDANGQCVTALRGLGQPCTLASQCASNICSASGHCCSTACSGSCEQCSSGMCSTITNAESSRCATIQCNQVVFGPDQSVCKAYSNPTSGFCGASGACLSGTSNCPAIASAAPSGTGCPDNRCFKSSGCVTGASSATITQANVCFGDWSQAGCPAGFACDSTYNCVPKKANGVGCGAGIECESGNCVGGRCCSTPSCPTCQTCASGTCTAVANGANAGCPSVDCSAVVAGFQDTICATYTGILGGTCLSGACDTSPQRCASQSTITAGRPSCGSDGCLRACSQFFPATSFDTVPEVCFTSGRNGCSVGEFCDTNGQCTSTLLALGQPCADGSQCASGICSASGHCCETTCAGACFECSSGSCNGIANGPSSRCPSVDCNLVVAGWSGTTCASYSNVLGGFCTGGVCDTSVSRCSGQPQVTAGRPSCADTDCRGTCPEGQPTSSYSSVASVCQTSGAGTCPSNFFCNSVGRCVSSLSANGQPCSTGTECLSGICSSSGHCCNVICTGGCRTCSSGTCQSLPDSLSASCPSTNCSNTISGWTTTGECATYSSGGAGRCVAGECQPGICLGQTVLNRPACGAVECRKACPVGEDATPYRTVPSVCHQNGQRNCSAGSQCDATGSCFLGLLPAGNPCMSASECASNFCSRSGHCCPEACSSDCQDCSTGTCLTVADGLPGSCAPVQCSRYLGGFNGTTCGLYARDLSGVCSSGACNTSLTRCAAETFIVGNESRASASCGSAECRLLSACAAGSLPPAVFSPLTVCAVGTRGSCQSEFVCSSTGTCVFNPAPLYSCAADPASCCNTARPLANAVCNQGTGEWTVVANVSITPSQTLQLNCSSLNIQGNLVIDGTLKTCFQGSGGLITTSGCAQLAGTVEIVLYETPQNDQKQYIIESPCSTITESVGIVTPVPIETDCSNISARADKDTKGIFVLFSVDRAGCESSNLGSGVSSAVIGGSVAAAVVVVALVVISVITIRNKKFAKQTKSVQRQLKNAESSTSTSAVVSSTPNAVEMSNISNTTSFSSAAYPTSPRQETYFMPEPEAAPELASSPTIPSFGAPPVPPPRTIPLIVPPTTPPPVHNRPSLPVPPARPLPIPQPQFSDYQYSQYEPQQQEEVDYSAYA